MYIYTLLCSDECKYFIGSSARILADPIVHFKKEYGGYRYFVDYPMTQVVSREKIEDAEGLENKVIDMIKQYGAYNVRGGSFLELSKENVTRLIDMNLTKRRSCILCKSTSHSSVKCTEYNSDDDSNYVPSKHEGSSEDSEDYDEEEEEKLDDDIQLK